MTTARLLDAHLQDLRSSGLSDATIQAARCYSAQEPTTRDLLGFGVGPGLVFEFPGTEDDKGVPFVQVKPDVRPAWLNGAKYISPKGAGCRVYVPPILSPSTLTNVNVPLHITEGAKKALKATQEGLACVALAGVDAWKDQRSGKSAPIPDLEKIVWQGRRVYVVYDSDLATKPAVRFAEFRLGRELRDRGADVYAVRLPGGPNGEKVGLDDYLCRHSVDTFCTLDPEPIQHPAKAEHSGRLAPAPPAAVPESASLTVPDAGMVGVARDFAVLYGSRLEAPPSFFYFSFLTYFGIAVAKQITLESSLWPEPRLYTVLLGESADTRKSTALRMTDQFWQSLGQEWHAGTLLGVGSAEGLAAELKDRVDHTVLLHFDELKSFVDKAKADNSVLLPMVSTLFERNEYDNRTKDNAISVRGASLALLAACTADTYATMFDQRFFAIGLLNRLWIVADRSTQCIPVPQPIPTVALDAVKARTISVLQGIRSMYQRNTYQAVPLGLTNGAADMFGEWYAAREGSIFERRLDTYGHRLMILLAATCGKDRVDEAVMTAVLTLLKYQLDARRECDPVNAENQIAALEERIRRLLARGALRGRDLKKKLHIERVGIWYWTTAIDNLRNKSREVQWDRNTDLYWLAGSAAVPIAVPTSK